METLQSPLNLAHIEERKAGRYKKAGKWDEAIASHMKASELLTEAQTLSEDSRILESLKLQHDSHIRQIQLLSHRKELGGFIDRHHVQLNNRMSSESGLQYDQVDMGNLRLSESTPLNEAGASSGGTELNYDTCSSTESIRKTIVECDSLLYILNKRTRSSGNSNSAILDPRVVEPVRKFSGYISASKNAKGDKEIMEELKTQNDDLRLHILGLLQEADTQKGDVFSLQTRNAELKSRLYMMGWENESGDSENDGSAVLESNEEFKDIERGGNKIKTKQKEDEEEEEIDLFLQDELDSASMDLPPLEIPQFDFDSGDVDSIGNVGKH